VSTTSGIDLIVISYYVPKFRGIRPSTIEVQMGMGMMWNETWELNGKWECRYGNVRKWELETHSRSHLDSSGYFFGNVEIRQAINIGDMLQSKLIAK